MRKIEYKREVIDGIPSDVIYFDGQYTQIRITPETIKDLMMYAGDRATSEMVNIILGELSGYNLTLEEHSATRKLTEEYCNGWIKQWVK